MVADAREAPERDGAHRVSRVYAPGEQIDRYEVLGLLGRGGMAVVYAVRRRGVGRFERTLALKMMLPHLTEDESYLSMFLDEIRIVSRIEHPNVVQVLDVGEHDGSPFMVMELLRGRTLAACLARRPPPALIAAWIAQVAEGLHAAHEVRDSDGTWLRVVHRDVSAANVHVALDGRARVLDFGIAGAVGRLTTTRHGELKGRIAMMAPEAITRSAEIDRRADVWALGVLAWESFTGERLFRGDSDAETMWRVLHAPIPPLGESAPEPLRDVIAACLVREHGARLATAADVADPFRAYAEREGATELALAAWVEETFGAELQGATPSAPRRRARRADERSDEVTATPTVHEPGASDEPSIAVEIGTPVARSARPRALRIAAIALSLLGAAAVAWALAGAPSEGSTAEASEPTVTPSEPALVPPSPPSPVVPAPAAAEAPVVVDPAPVEVAPAEERAAPRRASSRRISRERSAPETERAATPARFEGRLLDSPYPGGG
ncbi:serine/threonine-protein kinase [Sandaracinus amylolyticus]|nr:serine/threonine-protein kinase [Sandaracinus amylolyticus]